VSASSSSHFPWYRSFRVKLIITLFPILAGVTIASLWFAERLYSRAQQRQFETQFDNHIDAFDLSRQARFDAISESLTTVASNPALITRLRDGQFKDLRSVVEPLLQELGRQRLASEQTASPTGYRPLRSDAPLDPARPNFRTPAPLTSPSPRTSNPLPNRNTPRPAPPEDPPPSSRSAPISTYIALLDSEGHLIEDSSLAPLSRTPERQPSLAERDRRTRAFLRLEDQEKLSQALTTQQIGYKIVTLPGSDRLQVAQIFVTPIRDPDHQRFLGALVFGLPLPTLDERSLYAQSRHLDQNRIMSGIWVENQIISSTLPDHILPEVASTISTAVNRSNATEDHLIVAIDGVRHRVIYRVLNPDSPFEIAAQVNLYSLDSIDDEILDLRTIAAEIAGIAMLVSLGLILFVSRGLSGPVSALTAGTRAIVAGRFDLRLPVTTKDELGQLTQAFNDMAADLALQDRYRSVLDAVADPAVAQRLLHDTHDLGGVQKQVTMLFCDIRGFTALSEQLEPTDVITLVNDHMTALTDIAYQYGGTVDKFVGDLIMVLFGAPETAPDDAQRAVACAIAMQRTRSELNATSKVPLEIGIGIATGPVIVGCMGSKKRLNYTVLGHRVNLASRLCSTAGAGQIIIDDTTRHHLPSSLAVTPLQRIRLKGISAEIESYAIPPISP
jgi:class 3 adenylate cyclase